MGAAAPWRGRGALGRPSVAQHVGDLACEELGRRVVAIEALVQRAQDILHDAREPVLHRADGRRPAEVDVIGARAMSLIEISSWLAILLLAVIIGGSAPTVWRFRDRPVIRWVVYGLTAGVATAAVGMVITVVFSA